MNIIFAQARTWLGTKFVHQGRLKISPDSNGGVDCLGLLIGISQELGLKAKPPLKKPLHCFDRNDYSMAPDGNYLKYCLTEYLEEIFVIDNKTKFPSEISKIKSGDVLLFRFDANPQHVAIAGIENNETRLVHSYIEARKVVETNLNEPWISRLCGCYRVVA